MSIADQTLSTLGDIQVSLRALHSLADKFESGEIVADENFAHIVAQLTKTAGQKLDGCIAELGGHRFGWADKP